MKKLILLTTSILLCFNTIGFAQPKTLGDDLSLTRVKKAQGVYIFVRSEPVFEYDYLGTIKSSISWYKNDNLTGDCFDKVIQKARKKFNMFDAIIFSSLSMDKADIIRFKKTKICDLSAGGFRIDNKVSFVQWNKVCYGKIVKIKAKKQKAYVQYFLNGKQLVKSFQYRNIQLVSEDVFNKNANSNSISDNSNNKDENNNSNSITNKYGTFTVGDIVEWKNILRQTQKGEIIDVVPLFATVKVGNTGKKVSYYKLIKISSTKQIQKTSEAKQNTIINNEVVVYYKTTSSVNLRKGVGTSFAVVITIPKDSRVKLIDKSNGNWYKIEYNNNIGFVSSKYLVEE